MEICINNTYGTVCDDQWDVLDARVVCNQLLGYTPNGIRIEKVTSFWMYIIVSILYEM